MFTDSEVRGSKLAQRVEEIEKLIRSGAVVTGASLASMLDTAQAQLEANRVEDEHLTSEKKDKEAKDRNAIAAMVERESKLNEEEKKKYAEFLSKDYFKRSDLDDLSRFYADGGAYDRLSNDGKAEMNERVKEGIQRGEFTRDELPKVLERKALGEDAPSRSNEPEAPTKSSGETSALDKELKSVAKEDSKIEADKSPDRTATSEQTKKSTASDGLGGLAKLSAVQETDEVTVPPRGAGSGSLQIGG